MVDVKWFRDLVRAFCGWRSEHDRSRRLIRPSHDIHFHRQQTGSSEITPTYPNTIRILPAFSSKLLTAKAMVLFQASPCAICGGQRVKGSRFSQSFPLSISFQLLPTPYNGVVNTTPTLTLSHSTPKSWCPSSQRRALDRTIKINCHLTILYAHICKHAWIQDERNLSHELYNVTPIRWSVIHEIGKHLLFISMAVSYVACYNLTSEFRLHTV